MSGDERELRPAWQRHVGTGPDADRWFAEIVARHREHGRHHHGLRHVRWVVHHVRYLAIEVTDPPLVDEEVDRLVAAAFFHDAVYDVHRLDNETVSAHLARRALGEIGWSRVATEVVASLIEATAHHSEGNRAAGGRTADVLLAADLGVLAAEPTRYLDYVRAVRREYAHLDDAEWRAGRAAFVDAMLRRDQIFPVSLDLAGWERRARANLTAEQAALRR